MKQSTMPRSNTNANQQHNRTKISNVVLKIIFILGIPEIIGVIQFTPTNELTTAISAGIKIVYVIIRSLHGVFIFLCLVVTSDRFLKTSRSLLLRSKSSNLDRSMNQSSKDDDTYTPSTTGITINVTLDKNNTEK